MNKSYTVVNNQVIVKDDSNNETIMEYFDNIAEVLTEQNIIEEINNKIEELIKEKKNAPKRVFIPIHLICGGVVPVAGVISLSALYAKIYNENINDLWPITARIISFLECICLPSGMVNSLMYYDRFSNKDKAFNYRIEFLKDQLKKEQSYLDSLLQDKTNTRAVVDNTTFQVDHSTQIRAINNYANAIYEMARMSEKYYYNTETGPVLKHNLTQD